MGGGTHECILLSCRSAHKKYRKSRGYTIEQFSVMINKSKATVSKYENGTITIDIDTLYDISQKLDIDLKCFLDYQPPMPHNTEPVLPKNFYFNQPRAYMYYYDGRIRQIVRSLLCFSPSATGETVDVMLYVGVEDFGNPDRCQHLFTGEMKAFDTITHMVLNNQINDAEKCTSACSIPCRPVPRPSACSPALAVRRSLLLLR